MNNTLLTKYPGTITIAEESTAFPMVTLPPSIGGLGFNFKWDMGWMNDLLEYISIDPFFRKGSHNKITFGISYAFSENYILPFSHDEVVHGKCSMIGKVPGSYKDKFSALKVLYAYQIAYPGKKLNFMGNEIAQFIEWDFTRPIDWFLLDFETHRGVKAFVKDLNKVYLKNAPLYEQDSCYEGFKWIVVDDNIQNVFVFYRESKQKEKIIVVVHFSDVNRKNYSFGVPDSGKYEVIINTNDREYGGNSSASKEYVTKMVPMHGFQQSVSIDIEGNSAIYLKKSDK
jgi:1,4-alpha-glucan branching enzyme